MDSRATVGAAWGREAMKHGAPDYKQNVEEESAVDTIANVLHCLAQTRPEFDARAICATAIEHFLTEQRGEW